MPEKKLSQDIPNGELREKPTPWWRWLITLIALALFIFVISQQGWEEFFQTLKNASLEYVLAGLALLFVSRLMVAGRWYKLLCISPSKVKYLDVLKLTYAGLFATNFLPTSIGGDLVRFIGMTRWGMDSALVLASLIVDRLVGLSGMAVMLPGGIYLLTHPIGELVSSLPLSLAGVAAQDSWLKKLSKKIKQFTRKTISDLLIWLKHPRELLLSYFFTFLHMVCLFGMLWFFLRAVNENIPLWVVASIYSLSYLATLIPLSIGGLGIQEMSITYLYSTFGGVSMQAALALAVFTRMTFVVNSLPGVIFLPSLLRGKQDHR
jgi:hypothetical protein